MKLVYKCDFCPNTNESISEMENHENQCSFNPSLKKCWTCVHHVDEGMPISGSMYVCQQGLNCWDIEDEGKPCELWEEDK